MADDLIAEPVTLLDTEQWIKLRDAEVAQWQADVQKHLIEPLARET